MITIDQIRPIGKFNKPHGIKGEISATIDIDLELADLRCIITDIDGIFVPFFINDIRPKTAETVLMTIDGIDNEISAQSLSNKPIYALATDVEDEDDNDGFYASDFIGFKIVENDNKIGTITDIEDSTQNMLFILQTPGNNTMYIPIVDEFITEIDFDNKILFMNLPQGITEL